MGVPGIQDTLNREQQRPRLRVAPLSIYVWRSPTPFRGSPALSDALKGTAPRTANRPATYDIIRPPFPESCGFPCEGTVPSWPDEPEVSLFEIRSVVDLADAQGNGGLERFRRMPLPPCSTSGTETRRAMSASAWRSRSLLLPVTMCSLPTLTARRSTPVASTNRAASSGVVGCPVCSLRRRRRAVRPPRPPRRCPEHGLRRRWLIRSAHNPHLVVPQPWTRC